MTYHAPDYEAPPAVEVLEVPPTRIVFLRHVLDAARGSDDRTALAVRLQRHAEMPMFEVEAAELAYSAA